MLNKDMLYRHRSKAARPAMVLLPLLLLAACAPATGQGLFPSVSIGDNFARGQPTVATSTCEGGEYCGPSASPSREECALESCNSTCPHRPPPEEAVDLLDDSAVLETGTVSVVGLRRAAGGLDAVWYIGFWA